MKITIKSILVNIIAKMRVINIYFISVKRALSYVKVGTYNNEKDILYYKIMLLVHSLEKGMVLSKPRLGYGKEKIGKLISYLNIWEKNNYGDNICIHEANSILFNYIDFHNKNNFNLKNEELFNYIKSISNKDNSDQKNITGLKVFSKLDFTKLSFEELIKNRHSIREFSNTLVTQEELEKCLDLAKYYPSACNRQPCRIYFSLDDTKNTEIDKIVPGNNGFKGKIKQYIIVTSDLKAFSDIEVFQWYINGGIFVSFLILALQRNNIGSCIFQWPATKANNKAIKKIAHIKDSEEVICIIGIGKMLDKSKTAIAHRLNGSDILNDY